MSATTTSAAEAVQEVVRAAPLLRDYVMGLVRNRHDAEDILQDFVVRGLERGFVREAPVRGTLGPYLRAAVRNAALDYLRRARRRPLRPLRAADLTEPAEATGSPTDERRRDLLDRAWEALRRHEDAAPGSVCHTVLSLALRHPDDSSTQLAIRVTARIRRPVSPVAVRKQLSRARQLFARALLDAVKRSVGAAGSDEVERELVETGLMRFLGGYLKPA